MGRKNGYLALYPQQRQVGFEQLPRLSIELRDTENRSAIFCFAAREVHGLRLFIILRVNGAGLWAL